jgi:hypothetical protein
MKKINSRTKGNGGEREFKNKVFDIAGIEISRRLNQCRDGGHDFDLDDFAIEVKRVKMYDGFQWWKKLLSECPDDMIPAVAYRLDRKPWIVEMLAADLFGKKFDKDYKVVLPLQVFLSIYREVGKSFSHDAG